MNFRGLEKRVRWRVLWLSVSWLVFRPPVLAEPVAQPGFVVAYSADASCPDRVEFERFSADLGYVVFSSDRSGSYRLYEARRRR